MFYNDPYQTILGGTERGRWLGRSGRDLGGDNGRIVGPMVDRVFDTGEGACTGDQLTFVHRHAPGEEVYFTYSVTPIRDEAGEVGGVFCCCVETTGRCIAERRIRALGKLGAGLADSTAMDETCITRFDAIDGHPHDLPEIEPLERLESLRREAELALRRVSTGSCGS